MSTIAAIITEAATESAKKSVGKGNGGKGNGMKDNGGKGNGDKGGGKGTGCKGNVGGKGNGGGKGKGGKKPPTCTQLKVCNLVGKVPTEDLLECSGANCTKPVHDACFFHQLRRMDLNWKRSMVLFFVRNPALSDTSRS